MLRIRLQLKTKFFYSFFPLFQKFCNLSTFFYFITFTENYRSIVTFFPRKNQFTKNTKKSQPTTSTTELQFFWDTNYWNYNFKIHWTSVFVFLLWAPSSKKDISKNIIISSWIQKKKISTRPNLGFQQKKKIFCLINLSTNFWFDGAAFKILCLMLLRIPTIIIFSRYTTKKEVKKSYLELWTNYPSLLLFDTTFSTVWREK